MNVFLLYQDRDFDPAQALSANEQSLAQDLELDTLLQAMAREDQFILDVVRRVLLMGLRDPECIRYRQGILRDCLRNSAVVREIYALSVDALQSKRDKHLGIFSRYPSGILLSSIDMVQAYIVALRKLRSIAGEHAGRFESQGFKRLFAMIIQELDDDYFATMERHLKTLRFRDGVLLSAHLGQGNEGADYVLRRPQPAERNWLKRLLPRRASAYSFSLDVRDDHGARTLSELRDRGLDLVANAIAQSAEHIDHFFGALRAELSFYIGALNLREELARLGEPISFPVPAASGELVHSCVGLYDVCLSLTFGRKVVGNDLQADHKQLVIVTGANQGGKSTFVRGIGLAQLMMQCGLFVPAESYRANICPHIFSHYQRQEDATMQSGRLDEELGRMSEIISQITPGDLLILNESFAATNDREGSEIAGQVISALLQRRVKVFFVTHLYEFAHHFYELALPEAAFLRAGRKADGERTFKVTPGEPLPTSYGLDLYPRIFGEPSLPHGEPTPRGGER